MDITHVAVLYTWTLAHSEHGNKPVKILSKATLIPTLWLLSFLGSFFLFSISDAVQSAAVVTMLVSCVGYVASSGNFTFKYSPLTMLIGLLWAVAGISVACSDVPFVSLTYFFFFSAMPLTFLLFSFENVTNIIRPMMFIILALGVSSILQFYFFPQLLKFGGTHWPLADNNSLAVILGVGALLFIGEALRGGKYTYHNIRAALILFAGLMTTGGTAVFLGFLLVVAVFTMLAKPVTRKPVGVFMGGVILLMLVMYTSEMSVYHFLGSSSRTLDLFFDKGLSDTNDFSGSRLFIWTSAIEIFKSHPFLGTGIGTFFLYYPEFRSFNDNSAGFMAHNDFIQISTEMGIGAPLIALAIIGFLFYGTFKKLKFTTSVDERLNILIPFAAFGLMIGHSLVNFNMYVLPTLMMMGVFLAAWNVQVSSKEIQLGGTKTIREAICFIIIMAALVPLWGCYLSEYYTTKATDALTERNMQGFSDNLNLADAWGAGQNGRAVLQAAKFAAATEQSERALILLDRAQQLNPQLVQIYVERARIYNLTDPAKGLAESAVALQMDDGSIAARMVMSESYEKLNKPDEAYEILKAGLKGYLRVRNPREYLTMMIEKSMARGDIKTHDDAVWRMRVAGLMK